MVSSDPFVQQPAEPSGPSLGTRQLGAPAAAGSRDPAGADLRRRLHAPHRAGRSRLRAKERGANPRQARLQPRRPHQACVCVCGGGGGYGHWLSGSTLGDAGRGRWQRRGSGPPPAPAVRHRLGSPREDAGRRHWARRGAWPWQEAATLRAARGAVRGSWDAPPRQHRPARPPCGIHSQPGHRSSQEPCL